MWTTWTWGTFSSQKIARCCSWCSCSYAEESPSSPPRIWVKKLIAKLQVRNLKHSHPGACTDLWKASVSASCFFKRSVFWGFFVQDNCWCIRRAPRVQRDERLTAEARWKVPDIGRFCFYREFFQWRYDCVLAYVALISIEHMYSIRFWKSWFSYQRFRLEYILLVYLRRTIYKSWVYDQGLYIVWKTGHSTFVYISKRLFDC